MAEEAKARQVQKLGGKQGEKVCCGQRPEVIKGRARDKIAKAVGVSERTLLMVFPFWEYFLVFLGRFWYNNVQ